MFKFFVIAILLINAIFWGVYPVNDFSPHQKFIDKLNIKYEITPLFHILIGVIFYLLALTISHSYIS
tara:strand:- start:8708 stop:8908 length:201 start_codon:yes stop_codon:yes gene_type:complete